MGACASVQDRTALERSAEIDRQIEEDSRRFRKECKILLLGAFFFTFFCFSFYLFFLSLFFFTFYRLCLGCVFGLFGVGLLLGGEVGGLGCWML